MYLKKDYLQPVKREPDNIINQIYQEGCTITEGELVKRKCTQGVAYLHST